MKVQLVVVCISLGLIMAVLAQERHVYCGRNLASMLAALCENGLLVKRAEAYRSEYNALAPRGWPWLEPHRARTMGRGKRQVVSECCDKPCSVDEMLSYCAN
ncbi:insulin/IGF/Relaxin family domain-containing protein [Phthorimaea operculella]|nr:insulin/IGF/Relaxin family domain-containing protein [Phthorimaea operculella]